MINRSIVVVGLLFTTLPAFAADTIETWGPGAADFEVYSGMSGLGAAEAQQSITGTAVMGWGVAEKFSAYMATSLAADSYLANTETTLEFGVFGTPLDSEHVDLDLGLAMKAAGPGLSQTVVAPFWEVNLDKVADLAAYGMYVRGMTEIFGTKTDCNKPARSFDVNLTLGSYYSVSPRQQLLLEYEVTIHEDPDAGDAELKAGVAHVGYNVLLNDTLELITDVHFDIPHGDEKSSVGFFVGIIATLER